MQAYPVIQVEGFIGLIRSVRAWSQSSSIMSLKIASLDKVIEYREPQNLKVIAQTRIKRDTIFFYLLTDFIF